MRIQFIFLPLALALACGGDTSKTPKTDGAKEAAKDGDADKKPEEAKPAGPNIVELTKIGLKAEAPEGAAAGDAIVGEGVMIQGPGLVVTIEEASDSRPKTAEDAAKEADMYSPKNLKTETLADGWAVTFDNEGGMGPSYFVQVRREIDGKSYWCETTASQPEQGANALAACKSLKK